MADEYLYPYSDDEIQEANEIAQEHVAYQVRRGLSYTDLMHAIGLPRGGPTPVAYHYAAAWLELKYGGR